MAELSDLEKRRLLRERRAAKFLKGGATDRLSKITGTNNSTLSTSSPIVEPKLSATTTESSKRISQSFPSAVNEDDDPGIEDISAFAPQTSPIPDPLSSVSEPNDQDLEKILQQMLRGASAVPHEHSPEQGQFNDEFFQKMMSMPPPQPGVEPGQDTNMENVTNFKKYKTRFTLLRLSLILLLLIKSYYSYGLRSSSVEMLYETPFGSKFNIFFILMEQVFAIIHFNYIKKYGFHPGGGILNSVIPLITPFLPPKIAPFISYMPTCMDIFKDFQIDISLVIVFFGIVSIL